MTVRKSDINIPEPCTADWDEMHDRGDSRFCDHCTKDVHDLSSMTHDDAMTLLERRSEHLCVRYAHIDGEVLFKDSTSPAWRLSRQLEGAKKLLAAAALIVPMLAACEPAQPEATPEAVTPISIDAGGASLKPGAGIAPAFDEPATPTSEADEVVGKVAESEPPEGPELVDVEKDTPKSVTPKKIVKPKDPRKNIVVGKPAIRDPKDLGPTRHRNTKGKPAFRVGKPAPRLDAFEDDVF